MKKTNYRKFQSIVLFLTLFVLVFSFYIEFLNQLRPCPLCFMQRSCACLFGLLCVVGVILRHARQAKILSFLQCIVSGLGLYFASRQLWLQSMPVEYAGQCLPGLKAMMHYFSWDMILKSFFWGTSDCSHVDWQWYGLSIPMWSALYFGAVFVFSISVYLSVMRAKF